MEGITEAYVAGQIKCFPREKDLAKCKVESMNILYSGKTKSGDNLDVYVWEDKDVVRRIHYQMEKDAKTMCYTLLDFF